MHKGSLLRVKNVLDYKILMEIFKFSRQSWNNWKKENRPITVLIEKYFTNQDLEEFLATGKVFKLENQKNLESYLTKDKDFMLFCKFQEFVLHNQEEKKDKKNS